MQPWNGRQHDLCSNADVWLCRYKAGDQLKVHSNCGRSSSYRVPPHASFILCQAHFAWKGVRKGLPKETDFNNSAQWSRRKCGRLVTEDVSQGKGSWAAEFRELETAAEVKPGAQVHSTGDGVVQLYSWVQLCAEVLAPLNYFHFFYF